MSKYIMRLDDACEKRNIKNWDRMENLLGKYGVKPLVGVIPHCEDPMMDQYCVDPDFWSRVNTWKEKGWTIAMHGYNHVYSTNCGGINPVNKRSEFAGETLELQKNKIRLGIAVLREHGIEPEVFFAPSHTFDENTLVALKEESDIRIISDTIAIDCYKKGEFVFIPQQCGSVRKLPFKVVTFCYHPNTMNEESFERLENFLNNTRFISISDCYFTSREKKLIDKLLNQVYMISHR